MVSRREPYRLVDANEREAASNLFVAIARFLVAARGGATIFGVVVIAAPASNAIGTLGAGIDRVRYGFGRIGALRVGNPFANVADHVEDSPGVRRFRRDGMRLIAGISLVPGDFVQCAVKGVGRAGATRVFPLSFGRESELIPLGGDLQRV